MEQFDQLLTCCVCLDRYRTPKLLPCQHSYCMEPCMEGLVDYVKRQVGARRYVLLNYRRKSIFEKVCTRLEWWEIRIKRFKRNNLDRKSGF